jgi:hypothetical protein
MKYRCRCGNLISDNTDNLPYKARFVADQDWEEFVTLMESPEGSAHRLIKHIYQCPSCGRLQIENDPGHPYLFICEDENAPKDLLRSAKDKKK